VQKENEENRGQKRKSSDPDDKNVTKKIRLEESTEKKKIKLNNQSSVNPSENSPVNADNIQVFRHINIFCCGFKKENEVSEFFYQSNSNIRPYFLSLPTTLTLS
jgi:hypothetical protein